MPQNSDTFPCTNTNYCMQFGFTAKILSRRCLFRWVGRGFRSTKIFGVLQRTQNAASRQNEKERANK